MDSSGVAAPVIVGLAVGIIFVATFSVFMPRDSLTPLDKNDHIVMKIGNLKDGYRANEPISFFIYVKGESIGLCNNPQATAAIVSMDKGSPVWSTPPTFQTAMGCGNAQGIDREWRFGYEGEELPYQSALALDKKYDNHIAVEKAGQYKLVAMFDGHATEKEFAVVSASSGKSIVSETVQDGTEIKVQIDDKD